MDVAIGCCPGDDCPRWRNAKGDYEQKALACVGCDKCDAPPNLERIDSDSEEIEILVDEVSGIVFWENGGFETDWSCYEFEYQILVCVWREAERRLKEIKEARLHSFLKGFFKTN